MNPDTLIKASSLWLLWVLGQAGGGRQDYAGQTLHCLTNRGHRRLTACGPDPNPGVNLRFKINGHLHVGQQFRKHYGKTQECKKYAKYAKNMNDMQNDMQQICNKYAKSVHKICSMQKICSVQKICTICKTICKNIWEKKCRKYV